ncbi:MAG: DNA recombination protein RmuC [Bacteroides sp.]|nr:DNA recombination protein RmuC [Bacteroides sp.]
MFYILLLNSALLIVILALVFTRDKQRILLNQLEQIVRQQMKENREELNRSLREMRMEIQDTLHKNTIATGELQKQKFDMLVRQQELLIHATEKKLDEMRMMVEEKLQNTLNERISQSFDLVRTHLESVQKGLGEMKSLAQDVGGLKKVLSNVKMRGTFGEVQLAALLEQILSPEQYEANVKTKKSGTEFVEFAIRLPGKDDEGSIVYLPIDAKFPKDVYEQYYDAFEAGDAALMESSGRQLEQTIRKMARDIHTKYVDPPFTTEFAILFLPFESIYAEVIRRTALIEILQKEHKVIVTGPTTLGAILNSLQMGFRTLAIQKRTGEVWKVLGAVKTEFGKFGGLLEKVQKNLQTAGDQLEEVMGRRTRAIERRLSQVEKLPHEESRQLLSVEYPDEEEE